MSLINIQQYGCQWVCDVYDTKIVAFSKEECYEKVIHFLLNELGEEYYRREENLVL